MGRGRCWNGIKIVLRTEDKVQIMADAVLNYFDSVFPGKLNNRNSAGLMKVVMSAIKSPSKVNTWMP